MLVVFIYTEFFKSVDLPYLFLLLLQRKIVSKILGIIGGGQLGLMLTEAAKELPKDISKIIVLDPTPNCPASQAGAEQILADYKNEEAIMELAKKSDLITYEIESGNSEVLKKASGLTEIEPSPETLRIIQDKLLQKEFLKTNGLPVADFVEISSFSQLEDMVKKFGFPCILKARRDAYDGRGNYKINCLDDVRLAFEYFSGNKVMLEKFVDFRMEVSVISARNTLGDIATYPLVENIHEGNILRITVAPARVTDTISHRAEVIAHKTMEVLKGAGVFGIEMFVTKDDQIMINEIAPRVHNSGHHTLESSDTSQFTQHLKAVLGLKLGSTKLKKPTLMYNILGPKDFVGEYEPITIDEKNVYLKMYSKNISKPLRKLGHVNIVSDGNESIDDLFEKLNRISQKITVKPKIH